MLCRSTNQSGRNSVENLNSVDEGRGCRCRGVKCIEFSVDASGVDGEDRLKPANRGVRRFMGIAVGEADALG